MKCYSHVGDFSAFNQLKECISAQINQSERILQRHFDPAIKTPDRPDRLLKSRELSQILRFYLERSLRYGIFDETAAYEARGFLQSIEQGYALQFRRCALIFDFEKNGTDTPESEVGIEFHRVGKDLIHALLDNCCKPVTTEEAEEAVIHSLGEQCIPSVPKLEAAAFIAPKRARSTSWAVEDLWEEPAPDNPTEQGLEAAKGMPPAPAALPVDVVPEYLEPAVISGQVESPVAEEKDAEQPAMQPKSDEPFVSPVLEKEPERSAPLVVTSQQDSVRYDLILGVSGNSPQYGLLGEVSGRKIALDLNHTHTISLFGVQGSGKSYTLGTVIEMVSMPIEHITSCQARWQLSFSITVQRRITPPSSPQ